MKILLRFRYIVILPLLFYRYSLGGKSGKFLGITSDVYLIVFVIISLLTLAIEAIYYWRDKSYEAIGIKDRFEVVTVFLFSCLIVLYCIYVILKEFSFIFSLIAVVYLIQSVFWGVVLAKKEIKVE